MRETHKKEGFTLIEIVISMAIIIIISFAVYNSYLLLIKQTKDGEVKQTSTLIGKQIIEAIKSISGNDYNINTQNGQVNKEIQLTNNLKLNVGDNVGSENQKVYNLSSMPQYYNNRGELLTNQNNARYKAEVTFEPKRNKNNEFISINEIKDSSASNSCNLYVVKTNSGSEVSDKEPKTRVVNTVNEPKIVEIEIQDDNTIEIKGTSIKSNLPITISINFKYCNIDTVTIKVTSKTDNLLVKSPINICIVDNNNAKVESKINGVVNKYYRSSNELGVLYKIQLNVTDLREENKNNILFQSEFFQNINIIDK